MMYEVYQDIVYSVTPAYLHKGIYNNEWRYQRRVLREKDPIYTLSVIDSRIVGQNSLEVNRILKE